MNSVQQIHYWVTLGTILVAFSGVVLCAVGVSFPYRDKRGDRVLSWGVITLLASVAVYMIYAVTAVIIVVVMRS